MLTKTVGRVLLGLVVLVAGVNISLLFDPKSPFDDQSRALILQKLKPFVAEIIELRFLVQLVGLVQVVIGVVIVFNVSRRLPTAILAMMVLAGSLIFHIDWTTRPLSIGLEDQNHLFKNFAVLGCLLLYYDEEDDSIDLRLKIVDLQDQLFSKEQDLKKAELEFRKAKSRPRRTPRTPRTNKTPRKGSPKLPPLTAPDAAQDLVKPPTKSPSSITCSTQARRIPPLGLAWRPVKSLASSPMESPRTSEPAYLSSDCDYDYDSLLLQLSEMHHKQQVDGIKDNRQKRFYAKYLKASAEEMAKKDKQLSEIQELCKKQEEELQALKASPAEVNGVAHRVHNDGVLTPNGDTKPKQRSSISGPSIASTPTEESKSNNT